MINYVTVGSNQLDKAKRFYDAVFKTIGGERIVELAAGGTTWKFGGEDGKRMGLFAVLHPVNGEKATSGNGTTIGLWVDEPEQVDGFFAAAMALGATSEGAPGLREINMPGTYIAYLRDLDGNKLAINTVVDTASEKYPTLVRAPINNK